MGSQASGIACQSNLRQLGLAEKLYENVYKGYMPTPNFDGSGNQQEDAEVIWYNGLPKLLGQKVMGKAGRYPTFETVYKGESSLFQCPEQRNTKLQRRTYAMNENLNQGSIVFWGTVLGGVKWQGITGNGSHPMKADWYRSKTICANSADWPRWSDIPMFMDGYWETDAFSDTNFRPVRSMQLFNGYQAQNDRVPSRPHNKGMNVVFLDGHVEWVPKRATSSNKKFNPLQHAAFVSGNNQDWVQGGWIW